MLNRPWDNFWFSASRSEPLRGIRVCWSVATLIYLFSWFDDISFWMDREGVLNQGRITELLQSAANEQPPWTRLSPLYWIDTTTGLYLFLFSAMALAVIAMLGVGGRIATIANWFCILSIVHRAPMLIGLCEPLLTLGWAYLSIHPGPPIALKPTASSLAKTASDSPSIAANIALRLLQLHAFAWLFLALASQCAGLVWWQGEAVWWLASEQRSPALPTQWLANYPYLANLLTHGLIALEIITLLMLWPTSTRKWGQWTGWASCILIALISDQFLYPLMIAMLLLSFVPAKTDK